MKILSVRFRNLNSLAGEWKIDFTDPEFVEHGLFAITGPTGAGKSTILDAICLAMYGKTPRLGKAGTTGSNEIMTKRTGDCLAEVEFQTSAGGWYRATWMQHRARRRADGEPQTPKHQVTDLVKNELKTEKKGETEDLITKITGLDFGRFTKSVLLAQNAFAEFLKMNSDDRALLLEKITGTEIYAQISMSVFQRHSLEEKKLDALKSASGGITVLDQGQIDELRDRLNAADDAAKTGGARAAVFEKALQWLEQIDRLRVDAEKLTTEKQTFESDVEKFAPEAERLKMAESAAAIAVEWTAVAHERQTIKELQKKIDEHISRRPGLEGAVENARAGLKQAENALADAEKAQREAAPTIRKAREIDVKITETAGQSAAASADVKTKTEDLVRAEKELFDGRKVLDILTGQFSALEKRQSESAVDATIEAQINAVRLRFDSLQGHADAKLVLLDKLGLANAAKVQALAEAERLDAANKAAVAQLEEVVGSISRLGSDLEAALRGQDLQWWASERDRLADRLSALRAVLKSAESMADASRQIGALENSERTAQGTLQKENDDLVARRKTVEDLDVESGLLQERSRLEFEIRSLESHRAQLQDGNPCPLCGATEHPFATGNIPVSNDTEGRLNTVDRKLAEARKQVSETERAIERLVTESKGRAVQVAKLVESRNSFVTEVKAAAEGLAFDAQSPDLAGDISVLAEKAGKDLEVAATVIKSAADVERRLGVEKARHGAILETAGKIKVDHATAVAAAKSTVAEAARLDGDLKVACERLDTAAAEVAALVAPWGFERSHLSEPDAVLQELEARREAWTNLVTDKSEIEKNIGSVKAGNKGKETAVTLATEFLDKAKKALDIIVVRLAALKEERRQILAVDDLDGFEKGLSDRVDGAGVARDRAREKLDATLTEMKSADDLAAQNADSLKNAAKELERMLAIFTAALSRKGFVDEDSFVAARLDEPEIDRLKKARQELSDRSISIEARITANFRQLEQELARAVTGDDIVTVQAQLDLARAEVDAQNWRRGEVQAKLDQDTQSREILKEKLVEIETQKAIQARWKDLNDLIGSATGQTFRVFAQGLTFEQLVANANQHLSMMNNRYTLRMVPAADKKMALDLEVLDDWQGGEARTVKNLSGGETFIVSLALALGLASLTSRRIRIDSLFLDEGFGSLDEDALNTALQTLAELRRDGKLIGVISHVEVLKDSIPTKIEIRRERAGRSTIHGPGVKFIAAHGED